MSWQMITCGECNEQFCVSSDLYGVLQRSKRSWWCPNGHQRVFKLGPTEADLLRQERDRLKQQIAQKDDELAASNRRLEKRTDERDHERRRVAAARGQVTKLKNRAAAGVCPCCTRHFENLQRHMTSKHPDFPKVKQDADNVVPMRA